MQAQVNELVIETLADGVLVVDAKGRVHAANPAAAAAAGLRAGRPHRRASRSTAQPRWQPLVALAQRTFAQRAAAARPMWRWSRSGGAARRIHVRTRLTGSHDSRAESLCVMFLEDLREMEARLRTEKLAAMGRMSAAVAHEIRNPLAAIAQANALLDEDLQRARAAAAQRAGAQERAAAGPDRRRDPGHLARAAPAAGAAARRSNWTPAVAAACGDWARADPQRRAGCSWRWRRRARACRSTPTTCAACWSTCWTTRCAMPASSPTRSRSPPTWSAGHGQPAGLERRRAAGADRAAATCSSRSSRRKAAPAAWACTSAANCASATARPSATSARRRRGARQRARRQRILRQLPLPARPACRRSSFDTIAA